MLIETSSVLPKTRIQFIWALSVQVVSGISQPISKKNSDVGMHFLLMLEQVLQWFMKGKHLIVVQEQG